MRKKQKKLVGIILLVGIGILLVGGLVIYILLINEVNIFQSKELIEIDIHYYNDGVEVYPNRVLQSIINGGDNYDAIAFSMTINNNGQIPFQDVKVTSVNIEDNTGTNKGYITWSSPAGTLVYTNGNYYQTIGNVAVGETKIITSQQYEVGTLEQVAQPMQFYILGTAMNTYTGDITTFNSSKVSLTIEAEEIIPTYKLCYQESVNVQVGTDTPNCGLDYNGNYSTSGPWRLGGSATYDNRWNYYDYSTGSNAFLFITYNKPIGATKDSIWVVGDYASYSSGSNLTIPQDCWNYNLNFINFLARSVGQTGTASWYCYDGYSNDLPALSLGWKFLRQCPKVESGIFEEAMYWEIEQ